MSDRRNPVREHGFSLVELLVVITIIGILATAVTVKVIGALAQARVTKAKAEIRQYEDAVRTYLLVRGKMPESLEDLEEPYGQYEEGFIQVAKDPWGNDYEYERRSGKKFVIRTYGEDGQPGGEGEAEDIDSETLRDEGNEEE